MSGFMTICFEICFLALIADSQSKDSFIKKRYWTGKEHKVT